MEVLFTDFQTASSTLSGPLLAATLSPISPPHYLNRLDAIHSSTNAASVSRDVAFGLTKSAHASIQYPSPSIDTWTEIYSAYWYAIGSILAAEKSSARTTDWARVYASWKDLVNAVIKGYTSGVLEAWTLPVLYLVGKHLRVFAIKADESVGASGEGALVGTGVGVEGGLQEDIAEGRNGKLEDAARVMMRMFTLCISDRAPLEDSRKWGLYTTTNLLFRTHFRLSSTALSKTLLRALSVSSADMPPLSAFPRSHTTTFAYYVGVIHFLSEDYAAAETHLLHAWYTCLRTAKHNLELILTYLIPTLLLTKQKLPSSSLLAPYPRLAHLFTPLVAAIRSGSLAAFARALARGEAEFVKRRIYLTLERGRDVCLRNLFRKVFLAAGWDGEGKRRTRVRVEEFGVAVRIGGSEVEGGEVEGDEVECLVANMIYKGYMKGYISRQHGIVVLSKNGAFPGTGI
ncbi:COP9 signalosome (CSN) subunit [Puttea exsequens]|nr:COP9 signalosome (CSN) subunit [Puttea exsequens]